MEAGRPTSEGRLEKGTGRPGKDDERRRGKSSDGTECAEAADEGLQNEDVFIDTLEIGTKMIFLIVIIDLTLKENIVLV